MNGKKLFTGQAGEQSIDARYEDETLSLSQKLIAELFGVDVRTVSEHLKNIFASRELAPEATIWKFRIVQQEVVQDRLFESDFDKAVKKLAAGESNTRDNG